MTQAEKRTLDRGRLKHEITNILFNADDTIIMTSTAQASQLLLQKAQQESRKYGMKLNQSKCEHIGLNAIHRIQYDNGEEFPTTQAATYLGARVQHNGDHKAEVKARVIHPKVRYGMETLVISQSDYDKIDESQIRIIRGFLTSSIHTGHM